MQIVSRRCFSSAARSSWGLQSPKTVSVLGAPMCMGQPLGGVELGPEMLRDKGVVARVADQGWRVHDKGNVHLPQFSTEKHEQPSEHNVRYGSYVGEATHHMAQAVEREAQAGNFVLTLGGDHSIAIGSVAGLLKARPELGIVWVDAHADINTPATSGSGNTHGMVLGFLMRLFRDGNSDEVIEVPGFEWLADVPALDPKRIVYIGLRDVDKGERKFLRNLGIKAFDMSKIDALGIGQVMKEALDHLDGRPLHLSFDIDAIDPFLAPSTGTKVRGGLSFREAHYVCEATHASGRLTSMDMVEVNPLLDPGQGADDTGDIGVSCVGSALGETLL